MPKNNYPIYVLIDFYNEYKVTIHMIYKDYIYRKKVMNTKDLQDAVFDFTDSCDSDYIYVKTSGLDAYAVDLLKSRDKENKYNIRALESWEC